MTELFIVNSLNELLYVLDLKPSVVDRCYVHRNNSSQNDYQGSKTTP